ncbi:MAG TPA: integrase, partial [Hansschlegelia sp.]
MAARSDYLRARDGAWYYWRRVPIAYAALDRRTFVRISLKISVADDPKGTRAARAAERANGETEAYWRGLAEGRAVEAETRYRAARDRAKALGFDYVEAAQLSDRPADLIERLRLLVGRRDLDVSGDFDVAAVLGGEPTPELRLSGLLAAYETLQGASLKQLSPDQLR